MSDAARSMDRNFFFRFPGTRDRISVAPPPHSPHDTHVVLQALWRPKQREGAGALFGWRLWWSKEATVFIDSNRAYINGNIQYIIHTYSIYSI